MQLLNVVALTVDLPDKELQRGQVGTIVEELAENVYEVEFSDTDGVTYALVALTSEQLMTLHYQPIKAS